MKKFLTYGALGVVMTFGSAVSARANTVTYLFTAAQLIAFSPGQGGNCAANLSNCGVYGIGLNSVVIGGVTQTVTASVISPVLGTSDAWGAYSGGALSTSLAGMEDGTASGTKTMAFISGNTHVSSADTYISVAGGGAISGAAAGTGLSQAALISGSTQLGFTVTYSGTVSNSTPVTLNLELISDELNADGTANSSKFDAGTLAFTGAVGGTPEPSSVMLILGGIAGIAVSRLRRSRS